MLYLVSAIFFKISTDFKPLVVGKLSFDCHTFLSLVILMHICAENGGFLS